MPRVHTYTRIGMVDRVVDCDSHFGESCCDQVHLSFVSYGVAGRVGIARFSIW